MPEVLKVHRHEEKYLLSPLQAAHARAMLDGLLKRDGHSAAGAYFIRSLYFDTPADDDYTDKLLGISDRCKLRLRLYDVNCAALKLEIKEKQGTVSQKVSQTVTREQAQALVLGQTEELLRHNTTAACRAYRMFQAQGRRPAVLVDYRRTAWVGPLEHLRITLDEQVGAAKSAALFDPTVNTVKLHSAGAVILEIKYDHYFPGYLRGPLSAVGGVSMSISKYATARGILY